MRRVAYLLSLVLIFIIPWEGVIELPGLGSAAKLLGFGVAAFWVAMVIYTRQLRKLGLFHLLFFFFVLWVAASVFWSAEPSQTLTQLRTWVQLLILSLILWDLYTTRESLMAGLQVFVLGEYVAIGITIANFFAGNVYYTTYQRFSPSAQSNPDGFGIIVAMGIPLAWYLASSASTGSIFKLVNYAYIPAAFIGITLSGTRTALIASIVGMAFGLASLNRLRPGVRIGTFALLTVAILVLLPYLQPLRSFERFGTTATELTEGDLNNRTNNWAEGLESFAEHPILGVGGNMYRSVNVRGKLAHNSYISVLVELGLVGFVLFALMLAIAVFEALRQPKWDALFWLAALGTWAISASTLTYEYRKATWLFLTLCVASGALVRSKDVVAARVKQVGKQVRHVGVRNLPLSEQHQGHSMTSGRNAR
jgi:O-antigen ligase